MTRVRRWAPAAALVWAVTYGALRLTWGIHGAPAFTPLGTDLLVFTGWWSVGLCAAAAAVAVALLLARRWHRVLAVAAPAVAVALVVSCPLLLLDVVGVLVGQGLPANGAPAFASRCACATGAALLGLAGAGYRDRVGPARPADGATPASAEADRVPGWAWCAAYGAVAAFGLRVLAQAFLGFGPVAPDSAASTVAFHVGFVLAGVVLPLALVHGWGRTWPRWVPLLAGGRIPRLLVLGPALGLGGGLTVYFGVGLGQLTLETLNGAVESPFPPWFLWTAMPAYLVWGVGLLVAGTAYRRRTRVRSVPVPDSGRRAPEASPAPPARAR